MLLYPTGKTIKTKNFQPKAGALDFDDIKWEALDPSTLENRRGDGLASFTWFRIKVTVPEKLGKFDPTGSTVVFEIVVDDYSEIWVNGKLEKAFGQSGNGVVGGFNARNRVFLTDDAKPGESFQLAIFEPTAP